MARTSLWALLPRSQVYPVTKRLPAFVSAPRLLTKEESLALSASLRAELSRPKRTVIRASAACSLLLASLLGGVSLLPPSGAFSAAFLGERCPARLSPKAPEIAVPAQEAAPLRMHRRRSRRSACARCPGPCHRRSICSPFGRCRSHEKRRIGKAPVRRWE